VVAGSTVSASHQFAVYGENSVVNSAQDVFSSTQVTAGVAGAVNGAGSGVNTGGFFYAYNSSLANYGVIGRAFPSAGVGVGVIGYVDGNVSPTTRIGVLASFADISSTAANVVGATSSALIADNGNYAVNIFTARDGGPSGTTVFTIADGGATTVNAALSVNGNTTLGDAGGDTVTITANTVTLADSTNLVLNTTTGTKIGTGTTQKLGFYNATPVVQGASVADATGGATVDSECRTAVNALISRIEATGLIATTP